MERRRLKQQRIGESPIKQYSGGNPVLIEQQKTIKNQNEKEIIFMRRTEVISETMAAGTQAAGAKAGKGRLSGAKKAVTAFCGAAYCAVNAMPMTVLAAGGGTSAITQPLDNLKTLVIAVIGAVGVIILAKNVMEFAQAYQQQDSSTMNSALKGIVAGVMMAGISTVLTFFGF